MVSASELHEGMVVRIEGQVYKVLEVESKAGAAKMGGVVKAKLINVKSSRPWEPHFRPQERLEDLELERHSVTREFHPLKSSALSRRTLSPTDIQITVSDRRHSDRNRRVRPPESQAAL